ncbi:MAG: peptidase S8 [Anaerolineae bacterium]|nr:peptidase S8 [Anaerolineae bacterium]
MRYIARWCARLVLAIMVAAGTLALLAWLGGMPETPGLAQEPAPAYVPGEIIAKLRTPTVKRDVTSMLAEKGIQPLQSIPDLAIARLRAPAGREQELARWLVDSGLAEYAAPNYYAYAAGIPNDPYWSLQWNMTLINAPAGWDIITGSATITIAVLDTGVDLDHPDLAGRLAAGWDYVNSDPYPDDDNGHGTHVAGIIGALTNNSIGVAGVDWQARLMPIKVLNASGVGTYFNIIDGIRYAANVAKVINLSLVGWEDYQGLHDAVIYAANRGCLVVTAAGNCGDGGAGCPGVNPVAYPAAYDETLAVAAVTRQEGRAAYSEYHPYIDLAAPGGDAGSPVWSTMPNDSYGARSGTSMAAAHVSGLAGLLWALNPSFSATQVQQVMQDSARKIGPYAYLDGRNDYFGYGLIDVSAALRSAAPALEVQPAGLSFLAGGNRPAPSSRVTLRNPSPYLPLDWQAAIIQGVPWFRVLGSTSGRLGPRESITLTVQPVTASMTPGIYLGTLMISSPTPAVQNSPLTIPLTATYVAQLRMAFLPAQALNAGGAYGYEWLDARTGGIALTLPDDGSAAVNLPFAFPFYGRSYSRLWVSSNGYVSFGAGYEPASNNTCLPNSAPPNNAIYVFWDDLDPSLIGGVFVKAFGEDTFVIEWYQVPHAGKSGAGAGRETFQIVLQRDGGIKLQYQSIADAGSATIGVENAGGTNGVQLWCNGAGQAPRAPGVFWLKP